MKRKHVIGNWKMNGRWADVSSVLQALMDETFPCDVTICPSYPYLAAAAAKVEVSEGRIAVGAQNFSRYSNGAYTGEVSGDMLLDVGCKLVIIGHSERRRYFAETETEVESKLKLALGFGLNCVMCVGETGFERDAGAAEEKIRLQLAPAVKMLAAEVGAIGKLSVAYEPMWAIGTGIAASDAQIVGMHDFIRSLLGEDVPVLYGGSVVSSNAPAIMRLSNVDGVLVGGASLNAAEFTRICHSAIG